MHEKVEESKYESPLLPLPLIATSDFVPIVVYTPAPALNTKPIELEVFVCEKALNAKNRQDIKIVEDFMGFYFSNINVPMRFILFRANILVKGKITLSNSPLMILFCILPR